MMMVDTITLCELEGRFFSVHAKMKYRPDIDGLRAVAVLAVIFYHAGFKVFSGGFVGVDVFFVISGFLITRKIADNIRANEFTFIGFYERRIRRILPALFTTIFFALAIGALLYDAPTFKELGQSATATTLFGSNILFWKKAGYFEGPSALKPLLHMWSLSVEEQFYVGLPLLLVFLFRFFRKNVRGILAVIAGLSFILVTYTLGRDSSSAFYLTQGRVWELLVGSLLALSPINQLKARQRDLLSIGGIVMILASVVIYTDDTLFPGVSAALPVFASAMIIFSGIGGESLIGRVLSTKLMVLIGKISYSLYLWHWPLLVFTRVYLIQGMSAIDLGIWLGLTFLISYLSWKFIETPFRSMTFLLKPRIFYLAGSVVLITAITGYSIHYFKGLPIRFDSEQATIFGKDQWNAEGGKWRNCKTNKGEEMNVCNIGTEGQSAAFLLWGDSHANAVAPAVNLSAKNANLAGVLIWKSGCPPLLGVDRTDHGNQECSNFSQDVISLVEQNPAIDTVILASRWAISAVGTRYKSEEGKSVTLVETANPSPGEIENGLIFTEGLRRTVDALVKLDRDVILVSPIAEVGYHVPSAYFIASRTGREINNIIAPTIEEYQTRNEIVLPLLAELASNSSRVELIDPISILCSEDICLVVADSLPLYSDDDHLSTAGAYRIAEIFDPVFDDLKNR